MPADALSDLAPVTSAGRGFIGRVRSLADAERTPAATLIDRLRGGLTADARAEWLTVVVNLGGGVSESHGETAPDSTPQPATS